MARGSSLLAVCAALCLLAPLSASAWTSRQANSAHRDNVFHTVRRQLLQDQEDLRQNLEASSTRRLLASETTVPLGAESAYAVTLPEVASLNSLLTTVLELVEKSAVVGHFPVDSFPDLGEIANRFGFAPTNDSFCLFVSNTKSPSAIPTSPSTAGYYAGPSTPYYGGGYSTPLPYYNGNYNGYGGYGHYHVVDLTGPKPDSVFPYGLPPQLAYLLNIIGAELKCILGPLLPASAPPFAVFLEVLLEDATAVFGQVLKYLSGGISTLPGVENALDSDLIYLRDPLNPWGSPLKFEFTLSQSPLPLELLTKTIPYPPKVEDDSWTPPEKISSLSPVAASLPAGDDVRAVGYDGYLDQCQVILGSSPGTDGTFDKVTDFTATINDGAWSVSLATLTNNTGDIAYVVPAARSNNYGALTIADRKSAGYCYDIATLQPVYNPLAVPIPADMDILNASVAASPLSTVLVFGGPFGLDQPGLKTAFGIDQIYDITTFDALDSAIQDPYGSGAHIYREAIKVQNTLTLGASLLTNDSSTYASFAVLLDQAIARAAVAATNKVAANGFNFTGPALNLDSAVVVQDIYYDARNWVDTTSDPTLPEALSSADSRTIFAAALAANNLNAAADNADNATDIQKTAYYTQAVVVPQLEDVLTGASSVDQFQALTTPEALEESLASTVLPGSLTIPPVQPLVQPSIADTSAQASSRGTKSRSLSSGAIAGITIGCVAGVAALAGAGAYGTRRMRRSRHSAV